MSPPHLIAFPMTTSTPIGKSKSGKPYSFSDIPSPSMARSSHKPGTIDGWHAVIDQTSTHQPESGRYHLYIGLFCPFAHRANLVRHLKGLTDVIDLSVTKPYPLGDSQGWPGWRFLSGGDEYPNATEDKLFKSTFVHELYFKADPDYKGRYSVPVLWDTKENTIVSNESAELLRWLPTAFPAHSKGVYKDTDLYPPMHRAAIDAITAWMNRDVNTGVYKAGFAATEEAYEQAVIPIFGALNKLEALVYANGGPFVLGAQLTELDLRLYVTLVRFDPVYVQHFKCNLGMIRHDYPVLHNWLKNLYWNHPPFRESTDFKHIKENYTKSQPNINPRAITPLGPWPDMCEGVSEWSVLKPGGLKMPAVEEYAASL